MNYSDSEGCAIKIISLPGFCNKPSIYFILNDLLINYFSSKLYVLLSIEYFFK